MAVVNIETATSYPGVDALQDAIDDLPAGPWTTTQYTLQFDDNGVYNPAVVDCDVVPCTSTYYLAITNAPGVTPTIDCTGTDGIQIYGNLAGSSVVVAGSPTGDTKGIRFQNIQATYAGIRVADPTDTQVNALEVAVGGCGFEGNVGTPEGVGVQTHSSNGVGLEGLTVFTCSFSGLDTAVLAEDTEDPGIYIALDNDLDTCNRGFVVSPTDAVQMQVYNNRAYTLDESFLTVTGGGLVFANNNITADTCLGGAASVYQFISCGSLYLYNNTLYEDHAFWDAAFYVSGLGTEIHHGENLFRLGGDPGHVGVKQRVYHFLTDADQIKTQIGSGNNLYSFKNDPTDVDIAYIELDAGPSPTAYDTLASWVSRSAEVDSIEDVTAPFVDEITRPGDFSLVETSVAIDAGQGLSAYDNEGTERPIGAQTDIGALEYAAPEPEPEPDPEPDPEDGVWYETTPSVVLTSIETYILTTWSTDALHPTVTAFKNVLLKISNKETAPRSRVHNLVEYAYLTPLGKILDTLHADYKQRSRLPLKYKHPTKTLYDTLIPVIGKIDVAIEELGSVGVSLQHRVFLREYNSNANFSEKVALVSYIVCLAAARTV